MSFVGASQPLIYDRIGHADFGVVASIEFDPDQIERFLGPLDGIAAAIRRGPAHAVHVIKSDERVIGFYVLHPDLRDGACWWLGWFAIDYRMQGRGFGRASMAHIMSSLRRITNCHRVRLLVAPDNLYARRLYEQASFRPVGTSSGGELVLEAKLSGASTNETLLTVMIRLVATPGHRCHVGRLRRLVGPYAAPSIGVERGPPPAFSACGLVCTVVDPLHPALLPPVPHTAAMLLSCSASCCGTVRRWLVFCLCVMNKEVIKCAWQVSHTRHFD